MSHDLWLAENHEFGQARQHRNVSLILGEVVLAVLKSRRDFSREREPGFDFKAWRRRNRSRENSVRKTRVLPFPFSEFGEALFSVQVFNAVELN